MESQTQTQKFPCKVNTGSWYSSLEYAYLTVTSPAGGSVRISKWPLSRLKNKWDASEVSRELVWKCYKDACDSPDRVVLLTLDELKLLASVCDDQDRVVADGLKKPDLSSHGSRVLADRNSTGIRAGLCSCGGHLKTKDHGSWVGYFCPKCGAGGSYSKNSKFLK